jgi:NTE family protein
MKFRPKIGLALGGGGARGLAHIGVLKVLEEEKVPIDMIAGTSMGSIVGSVYAQNPNADKLIEKFSAFLRSQDYNSLGLKYIVPQHEQNLSLLQQLTRTVAKRLVINFAQGRRGIVKADRLTNALSYLLEDQDIRDTKIPFGATVTDLNSGETLLYREGSIRKAVRLSSSIPGYLTPEEENGRLLVDGGISSPVPIPQVKEMGADIIIGVSVGLKRLNPLENPTIIDMVTRTDSIRSFYLSNYQIKEADLVLHPDVSNAHWSEFLLCNELIDAGIKETETKIFEIKKLIKEKQGFFSKVFFSFMRD